MAENIINITENTENTEESENRLLLQFVKPYTFEGETYTEIDLSGLENITAADMIAAQKQMTRGGSVEAVPETSLQYACIIAARVTKQPIEFFTGLPGKDAIKLKNRVSGFFFGAD